MAEPGGDATQFLHASRAGDEQALERLMPIVHDELRRLARQCTGRERRNHTLQPTALVNEAYLRLVDARHVQWEDRAHFFALSARIMRRVLVDTARTRHYAPSTPGNDLVAIDEALDALNAIDPRKARMTELRFFGGLSVDETAAVLKVSPDTVFRDWRLAKAWLLQELRRGNRT
jgi:DNA-directed RNA polymerase specialized sigma24 family protein